MLLGFLTEMYATEGPYATVYLQPREVGEDAASQLGLRWQPLAQRLRAEGADTATVAALEAAVVGDPRVPQGRPGAIGAQGRALAAGSGRLLLNRPLRRGPTQAGAAGLSQDEARWAPLPHLGPLLAYEQRLAPHLLVVADRLGADVHVVTNGLDHVTVVRGEEHPLHKVRSGGWSHRRVHRRVENAWDHNAALVAESITKLLVRHRARLVLLAGDVRARAAISDRLPATVRRMVVETEHGGRAPGAAEGPLREEVARIAADWARRDHGRLMEKFATEREHSERAAEGLEQVIEAARLGQIDTLLLAPGARRERRVWVGPAGHQLALSKIELERFGAEEYAADRADAALIRACVLHGAKIELLDRDDLAVRDGVAALLRYSLRAEPALTP
ncbi:MAG: hypothetical protein GEU94_13810 [Micromonosporaceae bacterium]|nr:hypothetical protein [Micromonosporaceae bacterium]